jgi:hypothetical protein
MSAVGEAFIIIVMVRWTILIEAVTEMAVEVEAKSSIVIEGNNDDSNAGKVKRKRKPHRAKSKTYPARNRRSRLIFDDTHKCWVPKWLMLMGRGQNTENKQKKNQTNVQRAAMQISN